jgi:hypothetical protein
MAHREPSHPPSDPQPILARGPGLGAGANPSRGQLAAALLAGLVLVGSGLYVWRRPRPPASSVDEAAASASASADAAGSGDRIAAAAPSGSASSSPVAMSEPRVLACQDRGSKRTLPDACDRLAPVEKALESAITQAATCASAEGGTIEYVADVSFPKHKVSVSLPKAGRSVRDKKTLKACAASVREGFAGVGLDSVEHQHARYKIAVTATYRTSVSGG